MVILGVDPGYATIGYGVLDYSGSHFTVLDYGAVTTPAHTPFPRRLAQVYDGICELAQRYHPQALSVEKLYFNTNTTTAIDVAQARGVIVLAVQQLGIPVFEYTPLQVKQAVVGYGRAEKLQVMEMTRRMLNLQKMPRPDDAADALAMAVCHAHCSGSLMAGLQARLSGR